MKSILIPQLLHLKSEIVAAAVATNHDKVAILVSADIKA